MKKTLLAAALAAAAFAAPAATPSETAALAAAKQFYAVKGGDFAAAWNALPASYQKDVSEVVKLFASKIDADLWSGAQGALKNVAGAALKKIDFLDIDEEDRPDAIRLIAKAAGVANAASFDALKAGDLGKILAAKALAMPGVTDKVAAFKMPALTAKTNEDGSIEVSDGDDDETFKLVDGKWIPADLAEGFAEGMAEAKAQLASFTLEPEMKQQLAMVFPMISSTAKKAAKAATKKEFQEIVSQGSMPLVMMAMAFAPQNGGMPGMADDDDDEDDVEVDDEVEYKLAE